MMTQKDIKDRCFVLIEELESICSTSLRGIEGCKAGMDNISLFKQSTSIKELLEKKDRDIILSQEEVRQCIQRLIVLIYNIREGAVKETMQGIKTLRKDIIGMI